MREGGDTAVADVLESKSPALRFLLFLQVHNDDSLSSRPNIFSTKIFFCRASLFVTVVVFSRGAPFKQPWKGNLIAVSILKERSSLKGWTCSSLYPDLVESTVLVLASKILKRCPHILLWVAGILFCHMARMLNQREVSTKFLQYFKINHTAFKTKVPFAC